jgi:hypothetical protein
MKRDAVSAGDIVEFLKEFSKDLTSEVKSEIREASNAVDEFISPDTRQLETDKRNVKLYEGREVLCSPFICKFPPQTS